MTIAEFIAANNITMEVTGGIHPKHLRSVKPVKSEDGWEHYPWSVTLFQGRETLTTSYSTGTGHSTRKWSDMQNDWIVTPTPPQIDDVLDSLRLDSESYDNARDFEDFAANFGYDTDSRKAEAIYRACGEQAKKLRFFLGNAAYTQLIEEVEAL